MCSSLEFEILGHPSFPRVQATADGLGLLQHFTAKKWRQLSDGPLFTFSLSVNTYETYVPLRGGFQTCECIRFYQEGLLKYRLPGPPPRVSPLTGLGRSLGICIANKLSVPRLLRWSKDHSLRSIGRGLQWVRLWIRNTVRWRPVEHSELKM